jgi:lipopolysaccharide export system permease protein
MRLKTLDRYILTSFLKTFLSVFMILILIFMLYIVWQFIKELAGKELDLIIIAKFIFYILPSLVPLILPLTILVTSIMTFGTFSENYEFAAMKSAGISLQRAMGSLIVFIVILGYTTYQFANTVIPWSEFKAINLRANIKQTKPAMAIVENKFSDFGDIVIKVKEKSGENDEILDDIIIHKKDKNRGGNHTVIKSKSGILKGSDNPNLISLVLFDGNYYNELKQTTYKQRQSLPFVKTSFDEYILNIDLTESNKNDFSDESFTHPYKALNTDQLRFSLDSTGKQYTKNVEIYTRTMNSRTGFSSLFGKEEKPGSYNNRKPVNKEYVPVNTSNTENTDSLRSVAVHKDNYFIIDSLIAVQPRRIQAQILSNSKGSSGTIVSQIKSKETVLTNKSQILNRIELELHKKYAIGISCIVLFFVGAPLGAIIRKGGLGLPLVISIILFLVYHFFGLFAGNNAETGRISSFLAAWLSTFIMMPIGVYLTYRAATDQGFVNIDIIMEPL